MNSSILKILIISFIGLILIGYIVFRFYPLVSGPSLSVTHQQTDLVDVSYIDLTIKTARVTSLSVQGDAIDISDSGTTSAQYYLSTGSNTILIQGCDQYDTCKDEEIFVYIVSG